MIVDLHTHTFFSDGALIPSELVQRAKHKGYGCIGITDHVDYSNYQYVINSLLEAKESLNVHEGIKVLIGGEITHVHPAKIESLVYKIRELGADIIVGHGETITEPVQRHTNEAFIKSGVDILAHPGLIDPKLAQKCAEDKIFLEITYRKGHSLTNGYVVKMAQKHNAPLVIDSDAHAPSDLFSNFDLYKAVALATGLTHEEFEGILKNVNLFIQKFD